jgi:hypothetical protein
LSTHSSSLCPFGAHGGTINEVKEGEKSIGKVEYLSVGSGEVLEQLEVAVEEESGVEQLLLRAAPAAADQLAGLAEESAKEREKDDWNWDRGRRMSLTARSWPRRRGE